MPNFHRLAAARDESGFAMITAIAVAAVALLLAATLVASGEHLDRGTFRDRKWHTALQVAESGIERTMVEMNLNISFTGFGTAQDIPGGDFETVVASAPEFGLGRRSITSTAYVPSKNHANEVRRRIRVIIGPPPSFKYALFGARCLTVGNVGSPITGDVFSNGHVLLENGAKVTGDVYSAEGAVKLDNNAEVNKNGNRGGSVFSGGRASDPSCISVGNGAWGINVTNGSIIERDVHAQRPSCPTPDSSPPPYSQYGIVGGNTGNILGNAFAWGTIDASINITGPRTQPTCEAAPTPVPLPNFAAFDPALASSAVDDYGYNLDYYNELVDPPITPAVWEKIDDPDPSVLDFKAWLAANQTNLSGIHFINQDPALNNAAQVIDLTGATITDHFILVTPGRIYRANAFSSAPLFDNTSPQKRTVQLVSFAGPGNMGIEIPENNTGFNGRPCLLLYSTGKIQMKNTNLIYGAVYGDEVELKNGFQVIYDPCVESSLAFGPALELVENIFTELKPSG